MKTYLDNPGITDNRNYNYTQFPATDRIEYPFIVEMIQKNSRVLDLGCGNGSLLEKLTGEKHITGQGIEISKSGVEICRNKGLRVEEGKIDAPLPFADNQFDYAVCNVTIQMVMYPEVLLSEMKRIARYQIVSFPNFAHWHNRADLLMHGKMPRPLLFGYQWYNTGHIHQFSITDFENVCNELGLKTIKTVSFLSPRHPLTNWLFKKFRNIFSREEIYLLEKAI